MAHIDDPATRRANLDFIRAAMRAPRLSRAHEYAWWIRSAMQDYALRNWSIMRAGSSNAPSTSSAARFRATPRGRPICCSRRSKADIDDPRWGLETRLAPPAFALRRLTVDGPPLV
jgi:hypothetical protein